MRHVVQSVSAITAVLAAATPVLAHTGAGQHVHTEWLAICVAVLALGIGLVVARGRSGR